MGGDPGRTRHAWLRRRDVWAQCADVWRWAQAAADCVRCAALVLGPMLDGEGGGSAADPRSLTQRLARALEGPKFDKVRWWCGGEWRRWGRGKGGRRHDLFT